MRTNRTNKQNFDIEKNDQLFSLTKEILSNKLSELPNFRAWRKYFTRYIDPVVIHRKKDVKEFEKKFDSEFFQIIFAIHLIVYLLAKRFLEEIELPPNLKLDAKDKLFDSAFNAFSQKSQKSIKTEIEEQFRNIDTRTIEHAYDLFEKIYRTIAPSEVRKPLGEYFTPLSLAKDMVSEVDKKYENDFWMDNSSGFSVFLFAYLEKFGIDNLDKFVCIEVNPLSVFITKVALLWEYRNDLNKIKKLPIYWGDVLLSEKYQYAEGNIVASNNFSEFHDKIGVVIGNPPWVSWKSITKEYQNLIGDDWRSYDIFEKNITRKTLGACNDDLSSYFVYFSIDKFLKNSGVLRFVINLSLFKSNLAGKQFRQFNIKKTDTPFRINKIYDFSNYKVFQGITNSYCVFEAQKGEKTIYPIPYLMVHGKRNKEVEKIIETTARPANNEENGALITVNGNEEKFNAIEGVCEYKARAGVCTWLNSVYWVRKISKDGEAVTIENLGTSGKKKVKEIESKIEKDLVFRLLRARNLNDFQPIIENYIIVPQQKHNLSKSIPEDEMRKKYRNAFDFFSNFQSELVERSGYKKFLNGQPFYGLYNIGPYTTAPIKLGWQFVSKKFQVYLIDNAQDIIPDLNVMFIPLENMDEAYYLHALLNSKYATQKIESSSNWTFPSGSIQKVYLEKFNPEDKLHTDIANAQKEILTKQKTDLANEMDEFFREYWFNGRKKKSVGTQAHLSFV